MQSGDREIQAIRLEKLCLEGLGRGKIPLAIEITSEMKMDGKDKNGRRDRMGWAGGVGGLGDVVVGNGFRAASDGDHGWND